MHIFSKPVRTGLFVCSGVALLAYSGYFGLTFAYFTAQDSVTGTVLIGEWIPDVSIVVSKDDDDRDDDEEHGKHDGDHDRHKDDEARGDDDACAGEDRESKKEQSEKRECDGEKIEHEDTDKDKRNDDEKEKESDAKNHDDAQYDDDSDDSDESPCITLTTSLPDTDIYYEFSNDGNPLDDGEVYDTHTKCLIIPKGKRFLQAQAVRQENENWKSEVQTHALTRTGNDD